MLTGANDTHIATLVERQQPASKVCGVFTAIPQLLRNVRFGGGAPTLPVERAARLPENDVSVDSDGPDWGA